MNGVHHVTDQMDLGSQVLDSAKGMMRKRVLQGKPLVAGALDTWGMYPTLLLAPMRPQTFPPPQTSMELDFPICVSV